MAPAIQALPGAEEIAAQRGETEAGPIRQVARADRKMGKERVRLSVVRAPEAETSGVAPNT